MSLKIFCLVSSNPGHIDFGGLGYVKLARTLQELGHQVIWLSPTCHQAALTSHGFAVDTSLPVDDLRLNPVLSAADVVTHSEAYAARLHALRVFYDHFRRDAPDLLLIDRILALAPMLAEQLDIPSAAVGTQGGVWARTDTRASPSPVAVTAYQEVGDCLLRDLQWQAAPLNSFWAQSQQSNISFLARHFYGDFSRQSDNSWYVHHFAAQKDNAARDRNGVSFGNSGQPNKMHRVVTQLLSARVGLESLDIFCGSRNDIYQHYAESADKRILAHQWVSFSDVFLRLRLLVFFGGVGTLWHGIDHEIPMLIVTGGIGDQETNGSRSSSLGLSECLCERDLAPDAVADCYERLQSGDHVQAMKAFKHPEHYTDTLFSAAHRLERMV